MRYGINITTTSEKTKLLTIGFFIIGFVLSACSTSFGRKDIDYETQCKITNIEIDTKGGAGKTNFAIFCTDGDRIIKIGIKDKHDEQNLDIRSVYPEKNIEQKLTLKGVLSAEDINITVQDFEGDVTEFDGSRIDYSD